MKLSARHFIVFTLLTIMIVSGYFLFLRYKKGSDSLIETYQDHRDRHDVIKLFKSNWDWLVAGRPYSQGYVEDMLDKRTPMKNPLYIGALRFRVLRIDDMVIGFTAYYMEKKNVGRLLFLVLDERYRGKGYADLMTKDAISELQTTGATRVWLLTRSTNVKAQHLYRRVGFHEYAYDPDGFVYFEITP